MCRNIFRRTLERPSARQNTPPTHYQRKYFLTTGITYPATRMVRRRLSEGVDLAAIDGELRHQPATHK